MMKYCYSHFKRQPLLVIFVLIVTSCSYVKSSLASDLLDDWMLAPGFELQDMQGDKYRLSDYEGKTVIVNFWAVWCAPCRKEIPAMNRALSKYKKDNIILLAINVGDAYESIEAFSKIYSMDFTVLRDVNGIVSQRWQVSGFPTTFIINPYGQIVYRVVGGREWDKEDMLDIVRSIASKKEK